MKTMEEDCKNEKYEQFDTMDIEEEKDVRDKHKNKNKSSFSPNKIIKLLLLFVTFFCIIFALYHYLNNDNSTNPITESLEQKPKDKQLEVSTSNECGVGYKLEGNQCVINHSIKAEYFTKEDNERTKLIGFMMNFPIEMIIDGQYVDSCKEYIFPKSGNHTVYILSDFSKMTSAKRMFYKIDNLVSLTFTPLFDTRNVKTMKSMFYECVSLTSIGLSYFNTEKVTNMELMFAGCHKLTSINLSHFNTKSVTSLANMFEDCMGLAYLDLSNFNTEQVTDMSFMLFGCAALTSIDLTHFVTDKVTTMEYMFKGCTSLTSIDLSNFNTENVSSLSRMFERRA